MKLPSTKTLTYLIGTAVVVGLIIYLFRKKPNSMQPVYVEGEFTAKNCDELHAFESTSGRTIGGMNTKVNAELEKIYQSGINPQVTEVDVVMDPTAMKVKWKVKIEQSADGQAWVGFTSRGSSGAGAFVRANGKSVGQDFDTILSKVRTAKTEPNAQLKLVKDFLFNLTDKGTATGKCPTRQLFYVYTRPIKFPKH
jgi:hypothetical protein